MREVVGKTAFITGGASGIGLGMAHVFIDAGMNAVITDVREDHLDAARDALSAAGQSERARLIQLDVTDRGQYAQVAEEAEATFGRIDVLCNNAGIGILRPIGEASEADWDWALDVNVTGVFNGVKAILPRIRAHGQGGHVVNTASMAGILQYSRAGLYVASKFAVVGFSEALHAELAPEGIGVSAFCPGGVRSNIRDSEKTRPERLAGPQAPAPGAPAPGFTFSDADRVPLAALTATPEEAGCRVLQGIRDNSLYIFTAPEFRLGVEERYPAIRAALGEDAERERTALELIPGLVGSPIYRQALERER